MAAVGGGLWLAGLRLPGGSTGTPLVKPGDRAFRDNIRGVNRGPNGSFGIDVPWEFTYDGNEYVGRIKGPFPANLSGGMAGSSASTIEQVPVAFAMEARVVVGRSPSQARFGLGVSGSQTPADQVVFFVTPSTGQYLFGVSMQGAGFQTLSQGRAASLARGSGENRLRIEVRGNTLAAFVNGTAVETVSHDVIAQRPAHGAVRVAMIGEPSEGEVAVRILETSLTSL